MEVNIENRWEGGGVSYTIEIVKFNDFNATLRVRLIRGDCQHTRRCGTSTTESLKLRSSDRHRREPAKFQETVKLDLGQHQDCRFIIQYFDKLPIIMLH